MKGLGDALCSGILVALLLATPAAPALAQTELSRDERWRADLQFLVQKIHTIHPKPDYRTPAAEFQAAVQKLDQHIPELADHEVVVELMRLVALVRDGHTGLSLSSAAGFEEFYPVRLYPFHDGLFVQSAATEFGEAVGGKVLRIGNFSAEEALERVMEITNHDNEFAALDRAPFLLMSAPVLHALGISDGKDWVNFEVGTSDGARKSFSVTPVIGSGRPGWYFGGEGVPGAEYRTAREAASAPTPLTLKDRNKNYWFEHLPEEKTLFMRFNLVRDDPHENFEQFCRRMFEFVDAHDIEKFVLDLRGNHGGNNQLVRPLIHGFIKRDAINQRGRLFTIIDRGTFSAAVNTVAWMEEHTNTFFVGEPAGAPPNSYGDARQIKLPNSGIQVWISEWLWQNRLPWDNREWFAPHIAAPLTFADYSANRDPALEAILKYGHEPSLSDELTEKLGIGDPGALGVAYRGYLEKHPEMYGRTYEAEINRLGYTLVGQGEHDKAIAIFEFNTQAYPQSANTYDSLAEAYLEKGDIQRAKDLYNKALEVDPSFGHAADMLQRIEDRAQRDHE